VVVAGPPAAPANLTVAQPGAGGTPVNLRWQDMSPNAPNPPNFNAEQYFSIERATQTTGPWTPLRPTFAPSPGTGAFLTFSDTSTIRNAQYYYRIRSTNVFGVIGSSNIVGIRTKP
jgi:hypothetical protein